MWTKRLGTGTRGWIVALTLILVGCGSDPVVPVDDELSVEDLYGSWAWVSSEGGFAGVTRTPQSEGFEQTLVIEESMTISLLRNGELVSSTAFSFFPPDDEGAALARLVLEDALLGFEAEFVGFDLEGRLVLADPCCDGFIHTFTPLTVE